MPNTTAKVMLPADFADAPISVVRRSVNALVTVAAVGAVVLVLLPLGAVFGYLIYKGIGSINLAFLTQIPKPPGEPGGGMANAIAGSVYILMIASVFGVPLGIGAGIYLSEYGRGTRFGNVIRFTADVLNGVPSIIVGIVAYGLVVLSQGHFSALGGWRGSGHHDGPHHHTDDRRDAAAGAANRARSRLWPGCFTLADHAYPLRFAPQPRA